ncbi:MAG: hypothetical protein WED34_11410 [Planctomycetales bacterium]
MAGAASADEGQPRAVAAPAAPRPGKGYADLLRRLETPPSQAFLEEYERTTNLSKRYEKRVAWERELVQDFTLTDLLAAAREGGAIELRQRPELTLDLHYACAGGVAYDCLKLYTSKLDGEEGVEPLLSVIRDRHDFWVLRVYLLGGILIGEPAREMRLSWAEYFHVAGMSDRTLCYLMYHSVQRPREMEQMLRAIVTDPQDHSYVRAEAATVMARSLRGRLRHLLETDPNVVAYRKKHAPLPPLPEWWFSKPAVADAAPVERPAFGPLLEPRPESVGPPVCEPPLLCDFDPPAPPLFVPLRLGEEPSPIQVTVGVEIEGWTLMFLPGTGHVTLVPRFMLFTVTQPSRWFPVQELPIDDSAGELVRRGKVTVTDATGEKLRPLHDGIRRDAAELQRVLAADDITGRPRGRMLQLIQDHHDGAVDQELRDELSAMLGRLKSARRAKSEKR